MTFQSILFGIILVSAFSFFFYNVGRLISYLKFGKPEARTGNVWLRLKNVILIAFFHKKLFREPIAGIMHFFIFWGFIVFLLAVIESIIEGFVPSFNLEFLGNFYPIIIFLQDIFILFVFFSVIIALGRRYVFIPKRLKVSQHEKFDATIILMLILFVVGSMLFQFGVKYAISVESRTSDIFEMRIVSKHIAGIFANIPLDDKKMWYSIFWWIHIILILFFLNYLPFSKHLHILASIPNVYLAKNGPRGILKPLNLQDETLLRYGVSDVEDFTWKQLLDGYSCTECGRCTAICPAAITGKPLSPKKIIVNIRQRLMEKGSYLLNSSTVSSTQSTELQNILQKKLVGDYISEDELWSCTTCMGCMEECPVQIEHLDAIVDMRRFLVLNESRFPKEMQIMFQNLERNYSPWSFSYTMRAGWTEGLDVSVFSEKKKADILFWVGCAGAFDSRYQQVVQAFAKLMKKAQVDFAILGIEEKCSGDPARRAGNEYLAQMLIMENVATFKKYNFNKIVTTCPHCFNILKNEYPQFGADYEVIHHTQFINEMINIGKIRISKSLEKKITFHDSCYLGRYNQIYDFPRNIIEMIPGVNLKEMKRSKDRGMCCGAGGSRMFLEENIGKRVNVERIEEALKIGPDIMNTVCPFCMTMLTDGLKDKQMEERVQIKDIAELVLDVAE